MSPSPDGFRRPASSRVSLKSARQVPIPVLLPVRLSRHGPSDAVIAQRRLVYDDREVRPEYGVLGREPLVGTAPAAAGLVDRLRHSVAMNRRRSPVAIFLTPAEAQSLQPTAGSERMTPTEPTASRSPARTLGETDRVYIKYIDLNSI